MTALNDLISRSENVLKCKMCLPLRLYRVLLITSHTALLGSEELLPRSAAG